MVESMASGSPTVDHARLAGGLVQEIQERPGGIGGLLQSFQQNGIGGLVQQWSSGQTQAPNPSDVEIGLSGSGVIENIAQRTGISPAVVKTGLAVAIPLIVRHIVSDNHVTSTGHTSEWRKQPTRVRCIELSIPPKGESSS